MLTWLVLVAHSCVQINVLNSSVDSFGFVNKWKMIEHLNKGEAEMHNRGFEF